MFAAILTGPRINSHSELLHMVYFNLQRRKIYSIKIVLYNISTTINMWDLNAKNPELGQWPLAHRCKFPSCPDPHCKSV
jgi:hypothetical protein